MEEDRIPDMPSEQSNTFVYIDPQMLLSMERAARKKEQTRQERLEAAEDGDLDAQYRLGVEYLNEDPAEGFRWLSQSAENGHIAAMFEVGMCYAGGIGTERDPDRAAGLYRQAAEKGSTAAQCALGLCLLSGAGTAKDPAQAVQWFTKAADRGDPRGLYLLGRCRETGAGIKKDRKAALELYRQAAGKGSREAETALRRRKHWP